MLEGLLHHKKEEREYICALVVAENAIDAAIWETAKDGKVIVLKTTRKQYEGTWENAIDAADQAVTDVESQLPQGQELKKVVFGLFPNWLAEDRIKEPHLKELKELTTALSLTPLGFVELPIALAHFLQKEEGAQQTVILVGVDRTQLTVSLFKIGKLTGSHSAARTENITQDVEKVLASFTDVEVLPSRVLLYGAVPDLDKLKADLLNFPWQKKANFLHFPKIEVLPIASAVTAVAVASSSEIMPQPQEETIGQPVAAEEPVQAAGKSDEVAEIAEDLGFVTEPEERGKQVTTAVDADTSPEDVQNVEPVTIPQGKLVGERRPLGIKLPRVSLPKFAWTFSLPQRVPIPKLGLVAIVGGLVVLLGGGAFAAYWYLPKATVRLLVSAKTLDRTEEITVDPAATQTEVDQKILPGKEVQAEVNGSKSVPTTGKKTVGEKAKGEVTIYNKTLNTKVFKQGTVLTSGSLKFTLDAEVSVASASESVGSLTYGTTKAAITAAVIGTDSNVGPGTDFSFLELPTSSYSARNEKALAGGTSREIAIVTRDDMQQAREAVKSELVEKAEAELTQKLTGGEKLLTDSSTSKVISESFAKEVGEEANELTVEMVVAVTAFSYNQEDFNALLDKIVLASVPETYEYVKESADVGVEEVMGAHDSARIFKTRVKVDLLPKLETDDLSQKLAGRTLSEATEFLRSYAGVAGVEYEVTAPFASMKNKLPANSGNITLEITSL